MTAEKRGTQRVSGRFLHLPSSALIALALLLAAGLAATTPAGPEASPATYRTAASALVPVGEPTAAASQTTYRGRWVPVSHRGYSGGQALSSRQRGASATLTFTGNRVSWIGPTGPTRGKARVYLNGRYVRTVDTYSRRFDPSRVLYSATFAQARERRLTIVVVGTRGRPNVTIDALVARGPRPSGGATATPTPTSTPTPTPPPSAGQTARVNSVPALISALGDTSVREIVLANGKYSMSWQDINGASNPGFARTAATSVVVRAETDGGVTLNLDGSSAPHLLFRDGAAYQEWRGFRFGDSHPSDNGVIMFGEGSGTPVHHITLRNVEFLSSISAGPGPNGNYQNGQGLYFSWASGAGNHDLLVDGFACNAKLWSCVHAYHDDKGNVGHDITIRNMTIGTNNTMGIVLWSGTIRDWLIEDVTITGVSEYGVRHAVGGSGIVLRRVTTIDSGSRGFYSSVGSYPNVPGLTFVSARFN